MELFIHLTCAKEGKETNHEVKIVQGRKGNPDKLVAKCTSCGHKGEFVYKEQGDGSTVQRIH